MLELLAANFEVIVSTLGILGVAIIGARQRQQVKMTKSIDRQINHRPDSAPPVSAQIDRIAAATDRLSAANERVLEHLIVIKSDGAVTAQRVSSLEHKVHALTNQTQGEQQYE